VARTWGPNQALNDKGRSPGPSGSLQLGRLPPWLSAVVLVADEDRPCVIIRNIELTGDTGLTINEAHLTGPNTRLRQRVRSIPVVTENIWTFRYQSSARNGGRMLRLLQKVKHGVQNVQASLQKLRDALQVTSWVESSLRSATLLCRNADKNDACRVSTAPMR
jgi:hypothetical protein